MSLRRVFILPLLLLLAAPASAAAARLGTPEVITSFGEETHILSVSSAPGHGDAYAMFRSAIGRNIYTVVYRDEHGHAHRFDLPDTAAGPPEAVRLVPLEDGAGMAIWDQSSTGRILARSWSRTGALGSVSAVLANVQVTHSDDNESAEWKLGTDGRGTVAVATTAAARPASVLATIREPGGAFGPAQELTDPGVPDEYQRPLRVSPVAADGTVEVSWGTEGTGDQGVAVRAGRAPGFGPPQARRFVPAPTFAPTSLTAPTADGTPATISPAVAKLCPCAAPRVLSWADGTRVLTFAAADADGEARGMVVVRPGADGTFDRAEPALGSFGFALRRSTPGEVGFARMDTDTDFSLFRRHSRLIVLPFGPHVAPSRRAPVLRFGATASAGRGRLVVPVYCDRRCTVTGSSPGHASLPITTYAGAPLARRRDPFQVAWLRLPLPRAGRVRVTARAVDDARHRTGVAATFVRGPHGGQWRLLG